MSTKMAGVAPHTIRRLQEAGQSIWLDFIRRSFIESGDLERYVRQGWITGLTSNPSIFAKAIGGSTDYDQAIHEMSERGVSDPYEAFVELAVEDIQKAADIFLPVYEATGRADGFISLETPPGIENDADATVAEALRLSELVDRPNVMIKVPGTDAGIKALERLIARGINVNVTLIFSTGVYDRIALAYVRGVETFVAAGGNPSGVSSVASFFVSRIDTAVGAVLGDGHELNGQVAIANAREAYRSFSQAQQNKQWQRLADLGARPQRLLWASTSAKNPAFSDVIYVDELIMAQTVNTMPEATLRAFADHGDGTSRDDAKLIEGAKSTLSEAREAGVDLGAIGADLLTAGLDSFASDFAGLLDTVRGSLAQRSTAPTDLGLLGPELAAKVTARLVTMEDEDQIRRIWNKDHTLWAEDPTEISDRLGWLTVHEMMVDNVDDLTRFAADVIADGFTSVALLGMGGSSLAPEVLALSLSPADAAMKLYVLDTTDPAAITAFEESVDLERTLFVAASKSGSTIETRSQLEYFWNKLPNSQQYVVITDPESELVKIGRERNFRRVFVNQPDIGGRYSALSYFGLVPAALVGVDIAGLLDNATSMTCALDGCVPVDENPGAVLGAVLAEAALAGRDKATILAPVGIASFGTWAEQLIAESTGKNGTGIVPIESERVGAPSVYGIDRLFIAIGEHDGLDALAEAGHPVFKIPYKDSLQLGSEFLKWEMAVAVAGAILKINPFDQPNVQEAKDLTSEVLGGADFDDSTPPGQEVLAKVSAGDYVAFLAYIPRNSANEKRLARVRHRIRDRFAVATTVGFGPRFLHSTGQLHKGGPDSGVFFQIVGNDDADIPIPNQVFSFGELKHAQALGDLQALKSRGRRVARVTIEQLEEITR